MARERVSRACCSEKCWASTAGGCLVEKVMHTVLSSGAHRHADVRAISLI